jgi:hypothetical protein
VSKEAAKTVREQVVFVRKGRGIDITGPCHLVFQGQRGNDEIILQVHLPETIVSRIDRDDYEQLVQLDQSGVDKKVARGKIA